MKAAYSSGKPAFGVGPGNVPVLVDTSADLEDAIAKIVAGKSFDYGTVCSSEQAIVAEESLRDRIVGAAEGAQGVLLQRRADARRSASCCITPNWTVNPQVRRAGAAPRSPRWRASKSRRTRRSSGGRDRRRGQDSIRFRRRSCRRCCRCYFVADLQRGAGHLFRPAEVRRRGPHRRHLLEETMRASASTPMRMPANRVLVNTPAPQGSTGITTNVFPSMTLGCGAVAGNITSRQRRAAAPDQYQAPRVCRAASPKRPSPFPRRRRRAAAIGPVDRGAVAAAVERYLNNRGVARPAAEPAASPKAAVIPNVAAQVVDQFLARRGISSNPGPPANPPATCGVKSESNQTCHVCSASAAVSAAPAAEKPVEQAVAIADFVCEDDVRNAIEAVAQNLHRSQDDRDSVRPGPRRPL